MKYLKVFVLVMIYMMILTTLKGQSVREQFDSIKRSHQTDYDKFVIQKDKEFADFLRKNWRTFQIHDGHTFKTRPKPTAFPSAKSIELPAVKQLEIEPPAMIQLNDGFEMPVDHKGETYRGTSAKAKFAFYGDTVTIPYDAQLDFQLASSISPSLIGDYWEAISQANYRSVLDRLLYHKQYYGLNDFGYYLLIKAFAAAVFDSANKQRLFTWFVLAKSKYKSKIGYNEDQIYLLLPSIRKVFGTKFFTQNDVPYYIMNEAKKQLFAYESDYPGAFKTMDFSVSHALNLKQDTRKYSYDFLYKENKFALNFEYNKNAIDFYQAIPSIELNGYFNAKMTKTTKQSIIDNLNPILEPMNEQEAISFLLALVQKGFSYKVDEEQFGREKVFYPEEMLHYPYSDCEDRSVFFAFLVKTLLGNEIIGLDYPSHVATAVHFDSDVGGDYFMYDGDKYIVCDPTYINAPVGMSMRDLGTTSAKVIETEKQELNDSAIEKIRALLGLDEKVQTAKVIKVEEGTLMAGKYNQQILTQEETGTTDEGLILTFFNKNNDMAWKQNIPVAVNSQISELIADEEGNFLLLIKPDQQWYQLSKYDQRGNQLWSTPIASSTAVSEDANVHMTLLDADGNQLAGKSYAETAYFDFRQLAVRNNKIVVILPINDEQ